MRQSRARPGLGLSFLGGVFIFIFVALPFLAGFIHRFRTRTCVEPKAPCGRCRQITRIWFLKIGEISVICGRISFFPVKNGRAIFVYMGASDGTDQNLWTERTPEPDQKPPLGRYPRLRCGGSAIPGG